MDSSYDERSNHHIKRERSRSRSPVRRSDRDRSRSKSPNDGRRRIVSNVTSNKVIVRNIPYETPWQELKDLFRKEVGYVVYVELFKGNDGRPNGMGVVEFRDRETARKAIEKMNKHVLMGRAIIVREERESDKRYYGQNQGGPGGAMGGGPMGGGPMGGGPMGGGPMGGGPGMGNMGGGGMGPSMGNMMGGGSVGGGSAGISPQILSQLGIDGPVTNSVFVANLDYKVTWQKLKDVFKLAGKVLKAEIKMDKNGKSRGMGTVLFEHPMESVQAVSMFNGQSLFDRVMSVKIDNIDTDRRDLPQPKLPSGLKSIGMGLGSGGAPLQNISQSYNSGPLGGGIGGNSMGGSGGLGNMGGMGSMGGGGGGMGSMGGNFMDGSGMGNMGLGMDSGIGGGLSGLGSGMGGGLSGMGGGLGAGGGMSSMGGMPNNPIGGMSNMGVGMGSGIGSGISSGMGGGLGRNSSLGLNSNNMGMGMGSGGMGLGSGGLGGGDSYSNMGGAGMVGERGGMGMMDRGRMDSYGERDRGRRDDRDRSVGSLADKGFTTKPDNATVIVKNLPYSTQWKALKERFADVGEVRFAEIKMENGRSTGMGLIRFATQADAEHAINVMHKTQIEGREISVRMYR